MKKWRQYVPAGILILVMAVTVMLTFTVKAEKKEDSIIPDKVYFETINGGGLTEEQATAKIEAYVEKLTGTKITLTAGENTLKITAADLGLYWSNPEIVQEAAGLGKTGNLIARYKAMKDLEQEDKVYTIGFAVDTAKVTEVLENNLGTLNKEAVDFGLQRNNGKFTITAGVQGVAVNLEESVEKIEEYFTSLWDEKEAVIELASEITEPRGSEEEVSKVKDVLGTYTTYYNPASVERSQNVENGIRKINGQLLYPGDELSVYALVAPYTIENGYAVAKAYQNGKHVDSIGGGMCQVASTLYNAVIRAELEITERFAHSMTVGYVQPSEDATMAEGYKDLKFVNNTDAPVYIESYAVSGTARFTVYGQETRDPNRKVSFESETLETTEPGNPSFTAVNEPIGLTLVQGAHPGIKAQLWKVVTVNGQEVSREVFNKSTYKASIAYYNVGVSSSNPEATAAVKAAIATNDLATIQKAVAKWNDAALAAQQQAQGSAGTENPTPDAGTADSDNQ